MKKIVLFSLVGLLILLFSGCGLMPFATPEVEQPSIGEPPEVPEGLEIGLDPAANLEFAQPKGLPIIYYIPTNTSIGTWNSVDKIYTLNKNVNGSIEIEEDDLTLDGAGHKITWSGGGYWGTGVYLDGRSYVTVKNCDVSGFFRGIYFYYSSSNTLTDNTANNNLQQGIYLYSSSNNTLTDNTVNKYGIDGGIYFYGSSSNTLTNNTVTNNSCGIRFRYNSNGNEVYNNNFINNSTQALVEGGSGNVFSLDKPDGGNYWSNWTSPDNDGDGFVDNPYSFYGVQDDLPWVLQDGWKTIPPVADAGPDKTVLKGETVQFDGSSSYDPVGTIVSYEWNFDDGTTDSGVIVSHIYDGAGIYTVTLTVTDNDDNTRTDTTTITVQTPAKATGDLITTVESFELPKGIERNLTAPLEAAINALERGNEEAAIGQLNAFINHVEALKRAGKLPEEQADTLIAVAQRIIDNIQ